MDKIKILHLEDLPSDAELVENQLRKGGFLFEKLVVDNKADFEKALEEFLPDIILSDHALLNFNSIGALKIVKDTGLLTPFILVTATASEEFAVEIMKLGAYDYILKDRMQRLPGAMLGAIEKHRLSLEMLEKAKIQKETQELVLKNEKRFRSLIEKSTDMKTLSNREGAFIYCSPSITKALGYPMEELLHMSILDLIHPDDKLEYTKSRNAIFESPGKSLYFEQRLRHKNNGWIWCEGTLTNMLHEPGLHALVSNFKDISDKKKLEQQREFEETNLFALINNTNDLMWSVDRDFKLITSNQPFDKLTKIMFGKTIAKGETVLSEKYSPEKLNRFKAMYGRAFAGETFTETEYNSSPFEFWSEISYYPILKDKEVIGTACFSRNITERKRAEKALKQNEASLKEAQAIAHLGNWKADFATNMSSWSEEACRIYGFSPEENKQSSNTWLSFVHPEDIDYVRAANKESQKTFSDTALNYRVILKDGTIKYIYSKSRFEFDQDGKPVGLYGIVHDITEIKKAERQLIKSEAFNRGVLNSLKSHIAVIDGSGVIVAVNESWKHFALENGESTLQRTGIGSNYYEACSASARSGDEIAQEALEGIKDVMDGKIPVFYLEYPCHSPSRQRWFAMRAMKFDNDERLIVVAHMDISELKITQEELTNTLFELEDRVAIRTKELVDRNKSILDSINYAKRIQVGLLCRPTQLTEIFPKSFILFQPLDIVSGDFFWCYQKRNKKFIVLADCTGHGVPGALMSIIGNNLLTQIIINENIENPSEILELLDTRLAEAVKGDTQEVKDGMDITLCVVDTHFNELYFAGAYNPLFVSNENGEIHELAANRHAIGGGIQEVGKKFETKRFPIIPGQRIYLSSDGYYSQFGGPKGKKFMKSRFRKTLEELHDRPIDEQQNLLTDALAAWTGNNEQVDDIMVIGIEL